jgi:hypothetical protein
MIQVCCPQIFKPLSSDPRFCSSLVMNCFTMYHNNHVASSFLLLKLTVGLSHSIHIHTFIRLPTKRFSTTFNL